MPWDKCVRVMAIVHVFILRTLNKCITKKPRKKCVWSRIKDRMFKLEIGHQNLNETLTFLYNSKVSCKSMLSQDTLDPKTIHNSNTSIAALAAMIPIEVKKVPQHEKMFIAEELIAYNTPVKKALTNIDVFHSLEELRQMRELAIMKYLKLGSKELEHFYVPSMLKKHAVKHGPLYYSKTRLFQAADIQNTFGEEIQIEELGIQKSLPCLDKFSPIAISICTYIHREMSKHRGTERTWLDLAGFIFIFQGQSLVTDIIRACFTCRAKLRTKIKDHFGPLNQISLTFGALNRYTMVDLSGPYIISPRIGVKATRSGAGKIKVYLLHSVCLTSYLNCIVPIEDYGSQSFLNGLHRIGTRYGYPKIIYSDNSYSQIKAITQGEFSFFGLQNEVLKQTGIELRLSGASQESHSRQGRVEKSIHACKEYFIKRKAQINDLTPLQLDSLCSQAACYMNSLPLCTKNRNGHSNSSELVSPFTFLLGRRNNLRAPAGFPLLPDSRGKILESLDAASEGMFQYFQLQIPNLLLRPAKFEEKPEVLKTGDLVLFPFKDSDISTIWKLGLINGKEPDGDGISRIFEVTYTHSQEQQLPLTKGDKTIPKIHKRFTRRAVHTLVKIYSIEDPSINKDLEEINKLLKEDIILEEPNASLSIKDDPLNDHSELLFKAQLGYLMKQ